MREVHSKKYFFILLMLFFINKKSFCGDTLHFFSSADSLNKKRVAAVISIHMIGYGGSLAALSQAWYKDYSQTSFHFFDDSREWLQMDKAGHFLTSWYLGRMGIDMMEWSGMKEKKSIFLGVTGSFLYMTGIEMLDGFSSGWGFSWSDFSANTLGSALIVGQKILNDKNNFSKGIKNCSLKFSFHQTDFPRYRPSLLGKDLNEQWLKDYNGQTYWLSLNISSFLKNENHFPKWLNIAFGYGAEGMIGGKENPSLDESGNAVSFERYRKYFLSFDVDLTKIKTRSWFIKTLAETFCIVKIPAPSIEFSKMGVKMYGIYY